MISKLRCHRRQAPLLSAVWGVASQHLLDVLFSHAAAASATAAHALSALVRVSAR